MLLSYSEVAKTVRSYLLNVEELVGRVWNSGHRSVDRHGTASFMVEGVSQSLLRQLSRHPHINLTVKSSRYCDMGKVETVVTPFLGSLDRFDFDDDYKLIMYIYQKWANREGYTRSQRQELSKLMLPLGSTTDLVLSGNYQALYDQKETAPAWRKNWQSLGR